MLPLLTTVSSAHATLGKYHSSNLKPNSCPAAVAVSTSSVNTMGLSGAPCGSPLVVLNFFDSKCLFSLFLFSLSLSLSHFLSLSLSLFLSFSTSIFSLSLFLFLSFALSLSLSTFSLSLPLPLSLFVYRDKNSLTLPCTSLLPTPQTPPTDLTYFLLLSRPSRRHSLLLCPSTYSGSSAMYRAVPKWDRQAEETPPVSTHRDLIQFQHESAPRCSMSLSACRDQLSRPVRQ